MEVKNLFVNPPLLVHANPEKQYILETDASQFAISSVLLQVADDGREHPVAYFSRKLNPQQINYPVYDKELYAIVASLEHWRHHLQGAKFKITIRSDNKALIFFSNFENSMPAKPNGQSF